MPDLMNLQVPKSHISGTIPQGLTLIPDFLTAKERKDIEEWTRVRAAAVLPNKGSGMHYEWFGAPDFKAEFPEWSQEIVARLQERKIFKNAPPNSILLTQYRPGVGNNTHIDEDRYGEIIAGLSLGATCVMNMQRFREKAQLLLESGSMYVFQNEARRDWTHEIPRATSGKFQDKDWQRTDDRFSYTFRKIDDLSWWKWWNGES